MIIRTILPMDTLVHLGMSLGIRVVPQNNARIRLFQYIPKEAYKGKTRIKDIAGDAYYQAMSLSGTRKAAVCWHGFRDFIACLYERDFYALIKSSMATYRNKDEFETLYPATGKKDAGDERRPLFYCQACRCYDKGVIPYNRSILCKRIAVIEAGGDGRWTLAIQ